MVEGGHCRLLLSVDDPPSAVFCYNDLTAIGLIRFSPAGGPGLTSGFGRCGF